MILIQNFEIKSKHIKLHQKFCSEYLDWDFVSPIVLFTGQKKLHKNCKNLFQKSSQPANLVQNVFKMPVDIDSLTEGWLELESDPGK